MDFDFILVVIEVEFSFEFEFCSLKDLGIKLVSDTMKSMARKLLKRDHKIPVYRVNIFKIIRQNVRQHNFDV